MKVYLVRHGETHGNVMGTFSGFTDTPLTEKGMAQGKAAHQKIIGESFDVVISSPLSRAVDTAKLMTGQEPILVEGLKEMNFGVFEDLRYDTICENYPEEVKKWQEEGLYYLFPKGESVRSFYERVNATYQKLMETYQDKNLLIVAHSGVIRSIISHEISENFEHYWKYKIDNCGLSIIEYYDGYKVLGALNL